MTEIQQMKVGQKFVVAGRTYTYLGTRLRHNPDKGTNLPVHHASYEANGETWEAPFRADFKPSDESL